MVENEPSITALTGSRTPASAGASRWCITWRTTGRSWLCPIIIITSRYAISITHINIGRDANRSSCMSRCHVLGLPSWMNVRIGSHYRGLSRIRMRTKNEIVDWGGGVYVAVNEVRGRPRPWGWSSLTAMSNERRKKRKEKQKCWQKGRNGETWLKMPNSRNYCRQCWVWDGGRFRTRDHVSMVNMLKAPYYTLAWLMDRRN